MRIAVEMSLYPLRDEPVPEIRRFIERLGRYPDVAVETNAMSTQIHGEYARVMHLLNAELADAFDRDGRAVCVLKILGGGD